MSFDKISELTEDDQADLIEFIRLSRRKKELAAETKTINAAITKLGKGNGRLLQRFIDLGIQNIPDISDGGTVYIRRDVYAALEPVIKDEKLTPKETAKRFEQIKAVGYEDLVEEKFIAKILTAQIKEALKDDPTLSIEDALPDELQGIVVASDAFMLIGKG